MKSSRNKLLSFVVGSLSALSLLFGAVAVEADSTRDVLVHAAKPYDAVVAGIEALGGTVPHQYQSVDGLAARIPADKLGDLQAMGAVFAVEKDEFVELDPPWGDGSPLLDLSDQDILDAAQLTAAGIEPDGYYSYLTNVTGAIDTWGATGAGTGSVVAIVDSGTHADHPCLAGRVIEGPDFSWDAGTPFEGSTVITNGPHGTLVAGQVNSLCSFAVLEGHPVDVHLPPEAKFPYPPIPGAVLVPVYGMAPLAEVYAVKVFAHDGGSTTSRVIAAIDHVVAAKLSGALDVDVLSMSLGGTSLNEGRSLQEMAVDAATDAGITVTASAGNRGPTPNTSGRPATAYSSLAVGAVSDAVHSRIFWDLVAGPGAGTTLYPTDELRIAEFSSRGPYSDGRRGPDLAAIGVHNLSPYSLPSGVMSIDLFSGTSLSAPQVAGAAALLHAWAEQNDPSINARHIRNALIEGAVPMDASWDVQAQGAGFLNVRNSLQLLAGGQVGEGLPHASSGGKLKPNVLLGQEESVTKRVTLERGRTASWMFRVDGSTEKVIVEIDPVGGAIPPGPSAAFGYPDSFKLDVKSAKRSRVYPDFVRRAQVVDDAAVEIRAGSVVLQGAISGNLAGAPPAVLEPGLMKVTLGSAWTNNKASLTADVTITRIEGPGPGPAGGTTMTLGDDELQAFAVDVPAGTTKATFDLSWKHDWSKFPTNDLDILLVSPSSYPDWAPFFDGVTLNAPERQVIDHPEAGTWFVWVGGYQVQHGRDPYVLKVTLDESVAGKGGAVPDCPPYCD